MNRKNFGDRDFTKQSDGVLVPTNRYAANRAYCQKHSRAMLDIGGEKKCTECEKEKRAEQHKEQSR